MRIATWNVNSLPARLEKVWWWLDRAKPDVLLMQETKLADSAAPHDAFRERGYELVHHGQGRWNGVAIASRAPITEVITAFGAPLAEAKAGVDDPFAEARMISASTFGIRVASVYVPNGRVLDSPFYEAKLLWVARLEAWLRESCDPQQPLVIGGDFNIAPADDDVWDSTAVHGWTHVSPREREALGKVLSTGRLSDAYRLKHPERGRYSWWDYRAGAFHKNAGMRIDLLLATEPVAQRIVWAEIDREARKGKPIPSDHAPVVIDLDEPGHSFDARWERADAKGK